MRGAIFWMGLPLAWPSMDRDQYGNLSSYFKELAPLLTRKPRDIVVIDNLRLGLLDELFGSIGKALSKMTSIDALGWPPYCGYQFI